MRPKLPLLFGRLPKASLVVMPVPDIRRKGPGGGLLHARNPRRFAAGHGVRQHYKFATRLSQSTWSPSRITKGLPGHHLQISIAQELTGLPEFRKYTYYTAYTEGWGLYAERLGKDVGFYQDPYNDFGRLEARHLARGPPGGRYRRPLAALDARADGRLFPRALGGGRDRRAGRSGSLHRHGRRRRWVTRWGNSSFWSLRAKAQQALGDRFDLRAFHDQVLDSGALPLDLLEQRIDAWIAAAKNTKISKEIRWAHIQPVNRLPASG